MRPESKFKRSVMKSKMKSRDFRSLNTFEGKLKLRIMVILNSNKSLELLDLRRVHRMNHTLRLKQ